MQYDTEFLSNVLKWSTSSVYKNGEVYDCVTIITSPNQIEITHSFLRLKSLVYNEAMRDDTIFFSKNIKFLDVVAYLTEHISCRRLRAK